MMDKFFADGDARRFLTREECAALAARVIKFADGGGHTTVSITSRWTGELRWARNVPTVTGDRRNNTVVITRNIHGASGTATTNQTDDVSLRAAARAAERLLQFRWEASDYVIEKPVEHTYPHTDIWSETTYDQTPETRGTIARALAGTAATAGLYSAGYLAVEARGSATIDSAGRSFYAPQTIAQCSVTVRDPQGSGSGWAGASSYDWAKFDAAAVTKVALQKCLDARNPVAIEPGRYTAILEPQAVYQLIDTIIGANREGAEQGANDPFYSHAEAVQYRGVATRLGMSKLGERVMDPRITVSHDPSDPLLGVVPFSVESGMYNEDVEPFQPVTWIKDGVVQSLSYNRLYAIRTLGENLGLPASGAYRMSGGSTSMAEMIASTKRGVIVTRFSSVRLLDPVSVLVTGVTRDGFWLVENGKITHPVKNFRFSESPFFVFNNVEDLGVPVPIFNPGIPAIVPPVKVRDFNFVSLVDAV